MDAILVIAAGFGLMVFLMYFPITLWVSAMFSGVPLSPFTLIAMRFRGVDQSSCIGPMIQGIKAGIEGLELDKLEAHYLSQGNIPNVVNALISANKAHIPLTFDDATAIDLAGRDVLAAVKMSVNPRVISTPMVAAMCKDGIQVKATARITVRTHIEKLVGGAGEETILARVGEGICTTIGSAESHKIILENPDRISTVILEKGLDKGTAFEIVSIDIADVDVGKNIGAELSIERAEADRRIANAKAAERQAMAQAKTQEMIAYEQEMKAKVVEAQAEVPLALAEAIRDGKMAPMDYYKLKNLEADTAMRESFGSGKPS
jgi:uncharacterized protein YqfA (UPF0365 family)